MGWTRAKHPWVVYVHQDVCLPEGWDWQLTQQLREAERRIWADRGCRGLRCRRGHRASRYDTAACRGADRLGCRSRPDAARWASSCPPTVATLDELILIVRRDAPLRFDPAAGVSSLWGRSLPSGSRGGVAVVALEVLCQHNSRTVGLPDAFFQSARVFARKWAHRLPVATPCVSIYKCGAVYVLGNAGEGPGSVAQAVGSRQ